MHIRADIMEPARIDEQERPGSRLARIAAAREEVRVYCAIQSEIDTSFGDGRIKHLSYLLESNHLREQVSDRNHLAFMAMSHALVLGQWLTGEDALDRKRLEVVALKVLDVYEAIEGGGK